MPDHDDQLKRHTPVFLDHRHQLLAFVYSLTGDAHAAEDIFQEVWIKLAQAIEQGMQIDDPVRWGRKVAKNLVLHYWRDQRNEKVVVDSELVELVERCLESECFQQENSGPRQEALERCLDQLPAPSKDLIIRKYSLGCSSDEIGLAIQQTGASVRRTLSRLRRSLMECIERRLRLGEVQS